MISYNKIAILISSVYLVACGSSINPKKQSLDGLVDGRPIEERQETENSVRELQMPHSPQRSDLKDTKAEPTGHPSSKEDDLLAVTLEGGVTVGNGGDALVCGNGSATGKKSVNLLDYFEAEQRWGLTLNLGGDSLSMSEKIDLMLNRFARLDPDRAKRYRQQLSDFHKLANFWPELRLRNVEDAQIFGIPPGCQLVQLAVQYKSALNLDKYYVISKDLFDLLDVNQQIGLMLHEIIYREFIENGHENSNHARYLNALIASEEMNQMTLKEYIHNLGTANLPFLYQGRFPIGIHSDLHFANSDQTLSMARSNAATPYIGANFTGLINKDALLYFSPHNAGLINAKMSTIRYSQGPFAIRASQISTGMAVSMFENGYLASISDLGVRASISLEAQGISYSASRVYLNDNGIVDFVSVIAASSNGCLSYRYSGRIYFHRDGSVRSADTCAKTVQTTDIGNIPIMSHRQVMRYQNGLIKITTAGIGFQEENERTFVPPETIPSEQLLLDASHLDLTWVKSIDVSLSTRPDLILSNITLGKPWALLPNSNSPYIIRYQFFDGNYVEQVSKSDASQNRLLLSPGFKLYMPKIKLDTDLLATARNIEIKLSDRKGNCVTQKIEQFPASHREEDFFPWEVRLSSAEGDMNVEVVFEYENPTKRKQLVKFSSQGSIDSLFEIKKSDLVPYSKSRIIVH